MADASSFLRRWCDDVTRREREDLAQDAAVAAWLRNPRQRDPTRLPALVRTISRRLRNRALELARRGAVVADGGLADWPEAECEGGGCLRVGGRLVPVEWLLGRLPDCIGVLSPLNRRLLLGFYEGFSCSELSERFGLGREAVKVRLHRSRAVLRRRLEAEACAAGHFEA